MKLLEKEFESCKDKCVCGSELITSIRIPSNELFIMFINIRVLRLRSMDWKSSLIIFHRYCIINVWYIFLFFFAFQPGVPMEIALNQ